MLLATVLRVQAKQHFVFYFEYTCKTRKNIITLEDPVEYHLENVRQSQIQPRTRIYIWHWHALHIATRSRCHYDRKSATAQRQKLPFTRHSLADFFSRLFMQIQVLGTIARLLDMNIDPALIAYALNGVVAQRFGSPTCQSCKESYTPDPHILELLGLNATGHWIHTRSWLWCMHKNWLPRPRWHFWNIGNRQRYSQSNYKPDPIDKIQTLVTQKNIKTLRTDGIRKSPQASPRLKKFWESRFRPKNKDFQLP